MKVLISIVFTIGSVSALGSGPYLPSGWRPQGPSLYLPSEVSKASHGAIKENLLQETEASGSDALREYGPPTVVEVEVVNQGLPDVATEQSFFVKYLAAQEFQSADEKSVAVEASTEQATAYIKEVASTTEAQLTQIAAEGQATETLSEAQPTIEATPLEVVAEIVDQTSEAVQTEEMTEESVQEENVAPTAVSAEEEIVAPSAVAQEDVTAIVEEAAVLKEIVEQAVVERVVEGVKNIAEAFVKLENEVKAAEALEAVVENKAEVSGSLQQAPEGFLEYGAPGFREYGPPKVEDIARSAAVQVALTSAFENNEVRRRRFSPKFKLGHKKQ